MEVKSSQPIFPGQPPSSARANENYGTPTPQPPPRQSSQPPSRSSTSSNRSAFPGQTPTNLEFREPYSQLQHHSQQPSTTSPNQQAQQKVALHHGYLSVLVCKDIEYYEINWDKKCEAD